MTLLPPRPEPGLGLEIEPLPADGWERVEHAVFAELDRTAPQGVAVEPLSNRGWERVEDAVFAELDRADDDVTLHLPITVRPARWRPALTIAGFGMAAAAAAIALFALTARDGGSPTPLRSSRVETAEATTRVTHGEASLVVAPESAVVLSGDDDRGLLVVLERGSVSCAVPPRRGRPRFSVQAGDVRVEVVGTRFAVSREVGSASVSVSEGIVEVIVDGETTRVRAGERWPAIRTASAALPELAAEDEAEVEAEVEDEQDVEAEDDEVAATPRKQRPRRPRAGKRRPTPPTPPTAKQRFEAAASLEATDPDAASAIYRELSRGTGSWAASALYARARLELDRGNRSTGRRLLRRYLERFADGTNAADAEDLLDATR